MSATKLNCHHNLFLELWRKTHISHKSIQVITTMFIQNSSKALDISNVSHCFTYLRKVSATKKILIISSYHLAKRFQRKFS